MVLPMTRRESGASSADSEDGAMKKATTLRDRRRMALSKMSVGLARTATTASGDNVKVYETGSQRQRPPPSVPLKLKVVNVCRALVESLSVTIFTTILTVYALIGDDIRLLATNKTADPTFDALTSTCIVVFGVEIVLSIIGKDDYFLSFFFLLDIVSTVTLVLDLTPVNDAILGDEEDVSNMKGSRAAKIGARATRVVRVVRLVRILKLYKAIYEAQLQQKARAERARRNRAKAEDRLRGSVKSHSGSRGWKSSRVASGGLLNYHRQASPGSDDEDWDDEELDDADTAKDLISRESRVGKKLSELTTRKVIILVLALMLSNQLLRVDSSGSYATSAYYAADVVYEAFEAMSLNDTQTNRRKYERAFLNLVYYHNWFTGNGESCPLEDRGCPAQYSSSVFWSGIVSSTQDTAISKAAAASISLATIQEWELERIQRESSKATAYYYNFGGMPASVLGRLGSGWTKDCTSPSGRHKRRGFSFLQEELESPVKVTYSVPCPEDLRRQEKKKYAARLQNEVGFKEWHFAFYFDTRPFSREDAIFSLLTTIFVCIALCGASLVLSNDANRLVLTPLESMFLKVEKIRGNPLAAMKVADEDFKKEEMDRARDAAMARQRKTPFQSAKSLFRCSGGSAKRKLELMETVVLEKTIIKLGSLLALGFGEAGASIIEHNMSGMDSASVDAMVMGVKVECIIGAIRIRDFSVITEVLQAKVMTFVNQIAEIVHGCVDEFHGYASKNNGELFLMIWRTSDLEEDMVSKLGDMSLVSLLRILTSVRRSPVLSQHGSHPAILQRLGTSYKVQLSAGLHFGWAVEGAVGSEFKIDASYLSPNVSAAESLEQATKLYGVHILVSDSLMKICTPSFAGKCRLIDTAIIPGSGEPMRIYTMDINLGALQVEEKTAMGDKWTTRQRFRVRQFMEQEKASKLRDHVRMVTCFNEIDIMKARAKYTLQFLHLFNAGYQNYNQGEWSIAKGMLERTRDMLEVPDGPSVALLKFMEQHAFQAPKKWQGVRALTPAEIG